MADLSSPETIRSSEDEALQGSDVRGLLLAYDHVLGAARREPAFAWVRRRPPPPGAVPQLRWFPWPTWLRRFPLSHSLPRPTWLLNFFVVWHLDRTTRALHGLLSRRVATRTATKQDIADREALEIFRSGLPPVHGKTLLALLIVATVTLGRVALDHAGDLLTAVPVLKDVREYQLEERGDGVPKRSSPIEIGDDAAKLVHKIGEAIGPDVSSVGKTLDALTGAGVVNLLLVLTGTLFALYVVSRPFMPAFRLKRLLFNLADDPGAR